MSNTVNLEFKSFPSVVKMYPKMMLSKKPSLVKEGQSYNPIRANIENISADPQHVEQFAKECGFKKNTQVLPLPYPHVLAAPLHYALLNHKAFPVKLLGLVHVANSITQHREIGLQEIMDIHCFIQDFDDTPKGQVFHLQTEISVDGELVWEETCSFIARKKTKKNKSPKNKNGSADESVANTKTTSWEIPANMGRRFAKVSGDVNPIHLSDLSAKMFGFKKAIIHGVWSMSRTMSELEAYATQTDSALRFKVNFKLPVFIPCWVSLQISESGNGLQFDLKDSAGEKPHMSGSLEYL